MHLFERPSPNHDTRKGAIDMLVLHYTGMESCAAALSRLCDGVAKVSAHYLIDEDGQVFRLVDEANRAWHAGVAYWAGERDVNSRSIGIELVNPGHELGYQPFPPPQMQALAELGLEIISRHPIPPRRVVGHSDVAPGRKRDPGELFDWAWLAAQGIGLWPVRGNFDPAAKLDVLDLQKDLARFGYEVPQTSVYGTLTRAAVAALQRHFRPSRVDGVADAETAAILKQLLA